MGRGAGSGGEGWVGQPLAQFRDNAQLLTGDIFSADFAWAAGGLRIGQTFGPLCLSSPECRAFLASSAVSF